MVHRIFSEKRPEYAEAAKKLLDDLRGFLGIAALEHIRIFNRYDIEGIDEELVTECAPMVFYEPPTDDLFRELPDAGYSFVLAVEYLPGQFDQRADSAAQCVSIITRRERPHIRTATVYMFFGNISDADRTAIKKYLINPVESREASMALPETLSEEAEPPKRIETIPLDSLTPPELIAKYGLAMDEADVDFIKTHFSGEARNPTLAELRVIDTYWSDHCRHTTFNTIIDDVEFEDARVKAAYERYLDLRAATGAKKPICLMDIACIGAKALKRSGELKNLDESDEINACTVKIKAVIDGRKEDWLLLFKNETHNHPTEIEPFGGAATCVGGAIRDPLSGRSYVYQAMRLTGAANPLTPIGETIEGKLPQRKLVHTAAQGYSSYGNQIGLATGLVDEVYHDGYAAKHMEIGAVVGAAPAANVRRERPAPGDIVILLGGRTGRDGCGGATGSSKSHDVSSLSTCGAEVQKGNAPEERKLQRLFMNPAASKLIKCCNDFGAGGVSVAIGELADGLDIDLNAVPKKYEGLDGTELAISESQERMAVVVGAQDADEFLRLAHCENLEATIVAHVTADSRMVMNWNGERIVNLSREFLNSNGAPKHAKILVSAPGAAAPICTGKDFASRMKLLVSDLNICSKQGLSERFDSTIGAATVLMPFGGRNMLTPPQAMAAKLPVQTGETDTCSVMAYGFDPHLSQADPYLGAYCSVITSVSKLVASGASLESCYLTFQEYFEKLRREPRRWGKPFSALLGALDAQMGLKLAAIGGKDSMSGTFENIDVPPTLVSFAIAVDDAANIISPEFKRAGSRIGWLAPEINAHGMPDCASLLKNFALVNKLIRRGEVISAYTPTSGGIAEGIFKMCLGNGFGFEFTVGADMPALFERGCGGFILEFRAEIADGITSLGVTTEAGSIVCGGEAVSLDSLYAPYSAALEGVYASVTGAHGAVAPISYKRSAPYVKPSGRYASPRVLIPVFPGTNCELDSARAMQRAGAKTDVFVINNLTPADIDASVKAFAGKLSESQMLFIPGGFSGGDEPDGSAKLIASFMRSEIVADEISALLERRDGLILGICNGFQALIKLGLVPYGKIVKSNASQPTLTYNTIGLHRSRLVHTRVASDKSPWMMYRNVGDVSLVPVSHGEGRFVCGDELLKSLIENGQIASQYVDGSGCPSMADAVNPNGSIMAIEGITSPDGRVFGKMAHSERYGRNLYKNVPGDDESAIFRGAVDYFRL